MRWTMLLSPSSSSVVSQSVQSKGRFGSIGVCSGNRAGNARESATHRQCEVSKSAGFLDSKISKPGPQPSNSYRGPQCFPKSSSNSMRMNCTGISSAFMERRLISGEMLSSLVRSEGGKWRRQTQYREIWHRGPASWRVSLPLSRVSKWRVGVNERYTPSDQKLA